MREFMLLFRQPSYDYSKALPGEMQALSEKWNDWAEGIARKGKLASQGPRLAQEGKVLKSDGVVTDGPFVETKEILGSFIIVKADNLEEAVTLAYGCPALDEDGSVEIRPLYSYKKIEQ